MNEFSFAIIDKDKKTRARTGVIKTKHGKIETPYLVPVATRGNIIALSMRDLAKIKVQALLANTYHLYLLKGDKIVKKKGGLHGLMKFNKPIFTDSGGFQAFSLGIGREINLRKIGFFPNKRTSKEKGERYSKITEKGVLFKSVYDGSEHFIGPKESMKIQSNLGADIIMAFDECTSPTHTKKEIKESMERSHRWEVESLKYRDKKQALYGIIHGGWFKDLRIKSAKFINSLPFDGIAIGGSLGETKESMYEILDWIMNKIDERPRHMLGIGWIDDIFECVERGIDSFDCVEMTRVARHGNLYIGPKSGGKKENKFRLNISRSIYSKDRKPIDSTCRCSTCKIYSRSELHKLIKNKDLKYGNHATVHNIIFMENLTKKIREAIKKGKFKELKKNWIK